ncbi:hypothetical protein VT84_27365 [Gemmata sp. SH-PL17]|uniref:TIGR02996 domain-containing protein n=1 Tax=Gemmata sp. SH-PL17 TaxID=1630693 RepID=UPI0004B83A21|nr:TIGR02996 domain-containing protein [Gemmata sp. SH-PL17]AMV28156.1 hypothetical protein VT84_27365 [Gemmata sp. SH-PL17]
MSDEKALLAAIWEHPHDDTVRLIYADWLQENGQPARAEFIRLQCTIARTDKSDPQWPVLKKREAGLWEAHRKMFRRGLPDRMRAYPFARGFVAPPLRPMNSHKFHKVFRDLLPHAPTWAFWFSNLTEKELESLFGDECFRRIGVLQLFHNSRVFTNLVASPHAGNLTELHWGYSFAGPDAMSALCSSAASRQLVHLRFDGGNIGDAGAEVLGESTLAGQLIELSLSSNDITADGIDRLFGPGRFEKLQRLDLSANGFPDGDELITALVRSARLPALRELGLVGMWLTTKAAEALAAWTGAPGLLQLDLAGNIEIRAAGVRVLTESVCLQTLTTLDVFPSNAERAGIAELLTQRFGSVGPDPNDQQFTLRGGSAR